MSQSKFELHDLNDERATLGIKQCGDLSEVKTQMTSKIDNVLL